MCTIFKNISRIMLCVNYLKFYLVLVLPYQGYRAIHWEINEKHSDNLRLRVVVDVVCVCAKIRRDLCEGSLQLSKNHSDYGFVFLLNVRWVNVHVAKSRRLFPMGTNLIALFIYQFFLFLSQYLCVNIYLAHDFNWKSPIVSSKRRKTPRKQNIN